MYDPTDVARSLDVGLDGVCFACLGMVAMAIDVGNPDEVRREVRRLAPDLWADGLREQVLGALAAAAAQGVPGAGAALDDAERRQGRSRISAAVVLRLAEQLSRRVHADARLHDRARDRLGPARPEWN